MNLEARKLSFIQEILKVQSEKTMCLLESILKKENTDITFEHMQPMSLVKFNERIDKSLDDSKKGKLTEVNDFISEIDKWN